MAALGISQIGAEGKDGAEAEADAEAEAEAEGPRLSPGMRLWPRDVTAKVSRFAVLAHAWLISVAALDFYVRCLANIMIYGMIRVG